LEDTGGEAGGGDPGDQAGPPGQPAGGTVNGHSGL
jgi:hypothetical protein